MKKTVLIMCVIAITLLFVTIAFADNKVGYIDTDKVLSEYPKFMQASKQLQGIAEHKQMNARAAFEKENDDQKKEQIVNTMQKEIAQEEQKLMNPILKTVQDTVEKVAKQRGVSIVVNKGIVYYGGIDITNDVIVALKR